MPTETVKKGVIKRVEDENNTFILYPKTTIDQVDNLESTLDTKQDNVQIKRFI